MREIVLDTETTGWTPWDIVWSEGLARSFFKWIPLTFRLWFYDKVTCRWAFAIHGLSAEFLRGHKRFHEVVDEFLTFIGNDTPLVIHNASFDHGFLCAELKRVERALIGRERLVDTLAMARRKHSAGPYNLNALCAKYGIDNSRRTKHGALLDAEILAEGLSGIDRWPSRRNWAW